MPCSKFGDNIRLRHLLPSEKKMTGRTHWLTKSLLSACAAAAAMLAANVAFAANEPRFEVTPFYGYQDGGSFKNGGTDDKVKLNGDGAAAFAFNWRASEPGTQYELFYTRQSTDSDEAVPTKLKVEYLHIGGTTIIGEAESRVIPFAVGGIGATRLSPGLDSLNSKTRWSLNLGGGVRVPLTPHVRLRFEARGYMTWLGNDANLFCDAGCTLVARSKSFFQYAALGGVSVSF
jgi:opacity protein-like surface antigen